MPEPGIGPSQVLLLAVSASLGAYDHHFLEAVFLDLLQGDAAAACEAAVIAGAAFHGGHGHDNGQGGRSPDLHHQIVEGAHGLAREVQVLAGIAVEGDHAAVGGVALEGLPIEGQGRPWQPCFLVDVFRIECAASLQKGLHAAHVRVADEAGEGCARALDVARKVVHRVRRPGGDAIDIIEVDSLLEQVDGDCAGIAGAHAAALEEEGGLEYVAFQSGGHVPSCRVPTRCRSGAARPGLRRRWPPSSTGPARWACRPSAPA